LAASLVFGCGGGGTGDASMATQGESVQMLASPSAVEVIAPGASRTGTAAVQWATRQFAFRAAVTGGMHTGRSLAGTVLLKAESDGAGGMTLQGRLLLGTSAAPAGPTGDAVAAVVADIRARADMLHATFRSNVEALLATLRGDLAAATTQAQRDAARQAFIAAFTALNLKLQQDMAALLAEFRARLAAIGVVEPNAMVPGDDGNARSGFEVVGTIDAHGAVTLEIRLGPGNVVHAVGQVGADGGISGTFTGPAADDTGRWTAVASGLAPPEPPAAPEPPPGPPSPPSPPEPPPGPPAPPMGPP